MKRLSLFIVVSSIFFLGLANYSQAAIFYFIPSGGDLNIDDTLSVSLKIDSEGESINAAEGQVNFPNTHLSVTKIEFADSIFNFWIDEPAFSNEAGTIKFLGGTDSAVSGASLQTFKIFFKAKAGGETSVTLSNGAIALGDGSGTNVLRESKSALFSLKAKPIPGVTPSPQPSPKVTPSPTPTPRIPVKATQLPGLPHIEVPLYPDQERWYNTIAPFAARWLLPSDVSGIATALNKVPNFIPEKSEEASETKEFPLLDEGIWYLHVRFQNNIGWGPTLHYRIKIDTAPPLSVEAEFPEGASTDNPQPTLKITASDILSGISHYLIRAGNQAPFQSQASILKVLRQAPGKYLVVVKALDFAGNSREGKAEIEILPIAAPQVSFISSILTAGEGSLVLRGTAIPKTKINFEIRQEKTGTVLTKGTVSDEKGNWVFDSERPFAKGVWFVRLFAEDERGAISLPVEAGVVLVRDKAIVTIGPVSLTTLHLLVIVAFLFLGSGAGAFLWWRMRQGKILLRTMILQYDLAKLPEIIKKDLDVLEGHLARKDDLETVHASALFIAKRMRQTIERLEAFLKKEAGEIKEK